MPEAISASEGTLVMSAVVRRRDPASSRYQTKRWRVRRRQGCQELTFLSPHFCSVMRGSAVAVDRS
jgi:hypothetical protein